MNRIILIIIFLSSYSFIHANFILFSVTENVKIENGGKTYNAKKGMRVKITDIVTIPKDGHVEVLDRDNKKSYRSINTGRFTIFNLITDATKLAQNNSANVISRISVSKNHDYSKKYKEKGMISRGSLAGGRNKVSDPTVHNESSVLNIPSGFHNDTDNQVKIPFFIEYLDYDGQPMLEFKKFSLFLLNRKK